MSNFNFATFIVVCHYVLIIAAIVYTFYRFRKHKQIISRHSVKLYRVGYNIYDYPTMPIGYINDIGCIGIYLSRGSNPSSIIHLKDFNNSRIGYTISSQLVII